MKPLKLSHPWLQIGLAVVLVLGLFFRFVNLDQKVYWKDEAYTALRVSGYTKAEFIQNEFNGKLLTPPDLLKYQLPNPAQGTGATVKSLAKDAPQHSPLYFVLSRWMVQLTGDPILGTRLLSALFSVLVFPALYWLCLELFESPLIAWVAIALFAISPFQVLYAQEARQYSLWSATTLLASAALLRAMRLQTAWSWLGYAATLTLGLYTYLFTGLVAIAHAAYVLIVGRFRLSRVVFSTGLAAIVALVAYTPWIWVIFTNRQRIEENTGWTETALPLISLIKLWVRQYSAVFFDITLGYDRPLVYGMPLVMLLIGYAAYFLVRHAPVRVSLFIATLAIVPFLPLALPDVVLGGVRSITGRYLVPSFLGVQLAVAYLLGIQLKPIAVKVWQQQVWRLVMVVVITAGIVSCAISATADTWSTKSASYYDPEVARIVNQAERPLLISSDNTNVNIISLGYLLDDKVQLQLMTEPTFPVIPSGFSDVFLYNVSGDYADLFKQHGYHLEKLVDSKPTKLWRLTR